MSKIRSLPWKQLFRFVIVGVLNTFAALGIYWSALWFGAPYWIASATSLILGVVISFRSHSRYVFGAGAKFARYVGVWLFIYALNLLGLHLVRSYVGDYAAAVVLLPFNVAISYFLFRCFVFRPEILHPDGTDPGTPPTAKVK